MKEKPFPFLVSKALEKRVEGKKIRINESMIERNLRALQLYNIKLQEEVKRLRQKLKENKEKYEREIARLREDNSILRSLANNLRRRMRMRKF